MKNSLDFELMERAVKEEIRIKDKMNMRKAYNLGDMLSKGSQLLRAKENEELRNIKGIEVYSAQEQKDINDKQNQTEESNNGLAERIVKKDVEAIINSDIIVAEPQTFALGSISEIGILYGLDISYDMIMNWFKENGQVELSEKFEKEMKSKFVKDIYPHMEDIRRTNIPEVGDRRSYGVNQFVYGLCLHLTNGKGFYEWEEILKKLENKAGE